MRNVSGKVILRRVILVNAMHITASVFINDDESGLHHDYDIWLEKLAPMNRFLNTVITLERIMPMPI